jgi:hypothetical protein
VQAGGGASEDRLVVEGALPRDGTGRLLVPFRPGDVLRVSMPFVETTVTGVTRSTVVLRWPWRRVDPASRYGWTGGEFGFLVDELHKILYRTEPPLPRLRAGQRCRVGIPPTLVHVLFVMELAAPEDTGMLPRPSGWLTLLPAGTPFEPTNREPSIDVELVAASEPGGPTPGVEMAEPIRMELVFRPYAFLADGDVVTDPGGRRWRFQAPFWWQELDGPARQAGSAAAPEWPLRLASQGGAPAVARGAEVAAATTSGSHQREVARWRQLANAEPVPITPFVERPPTAGDR